MAKASAPGRAKTRLVPPLTFDEAAVLNTAFLQDVADNVLLAGRDAERHGGIAGYAAYGPPGSEDFFRRTLPGAHRLDRGLAAKFRRLPVAHDRGDFRARTRVRRGAQFRQPDIADGVPGRDRGSVGAAGRPRRARSVERRRLLSARAENRASPHVREYRLEHRAGRQTNSGTGARDRSRRASAAGLVRRRRCRRLAPAVRRIAGPARCATAPPRQEPAASRRAHGGIDE